METQKDSLQGVVILIGALLCQVILGELTLTGGIFYVIYREAFNSSPVVTSWLCSLPMTLWMMSGNATLLLLNQLVTNVFSHPYHLDESTLIFRSIGSDFSFLFHFPLKFMSANKKATDGTPRFAASQLGLFCWPIFPKKERQLYYG